MKTKYLITLLTLMTFFFACNPDEEVLTTPVTIPMTFTCSLDGQSYSFSGNYDVGAANSGYSTGQLGGGMLSIVLKQPYVGGITPFGVTISLLMDSPQTGTFFVDSLSTASNSLSVVKMVNTNLLDPNNVTAGSLFGGGVTINITEFGANSYQNNPENPGRVKGNFQGIVQEPDGTEHTISGSFDSVRQI